jgi:hypothetical protein
MHANCESISTVLTSGRYHYVRRILSNREKHVRSDMSGIK